MQIKLIVIASVKTCIIKILDVKMKYKYISREIFEGLSLFTLPNAMLIIVLQISGIPLYFVFLSRICLSTYSKTFHTLF